MNRREFAAILACAVPGSAAGSMVETVVGPVPVSELGPTLVHEHVMVDFIGAEGVSRWRYDPNEVFRAALPRVKEVKARGCKTLVECTPAYLGRDPVLLKRLSSAAGIHILTNTGYYGAASDKHVPKHAFSESAMQIAQRWIREARHGIEGTAIRPAFMKIGVDPGPLSPIDAKLVAAAALCHRRTGLRLHVHTGNGVAALGIAEVLTKSNVPLRAYVWVHAQNEKDFSVLEELAAAGAWIELDGVNASTHQAHIDAVTRLAGKGYLGKLLISQDSGWYHVGEPGGGKFNGYVYLFDHFVPALQREGFSQKQIDTLLIENTGKVLTPETPAK